MLRHVYSIEIDESLSQACSPPFEKVNELHEIPKLTIEIDQ
jgi:hypothetical protein